MWPPRSVVGAFVVLALGLLLAAVSRTGPAEAPDAAPEVPAIDVAQLSGPARAAAIAALAEAARDVGIVRLVNHGVDVAAARAAGRAYFALPQRLKACAACSRRNASVGFQRGYIPFASESGLAGTLEVKEGFSYGFEWPAARAPEHPFQAANVWPPGEAASILGERWRRDMLALFNASIRISTTAVAAFAEALGAQGSALPALCDGGETISQMRMFHYLPPPAGCGEKCLGSSPHTDWHFVTIISRDEASALQYVDRRTGLWRNFRTSEDELLLLVGDWLAAFSGDFFHAPAHRVTLPTTESSLSFVLFFYPAISARLPQRRRELQGHGEDINTVEASMFDLSWGDYVVRKWVKVMSNR